MKSLQKSWLSATITISVGIITLFPTVVQAVSFITNRDRLGANDLLDWSVLGPGNPFFPPDSPFPIYPTVPNAFTTISQGGINIEGNIPAGEFLRIDQTSSLPGFLGPDFPGGFDNGESLLFTGLNNPGPLTLTFDQPVYGVGTQIQSDPSMNAQPAPGGFLYTALIEAFDRFDNSLGIFDLEGVSVRDTGAGVIFLGIYDENGDISKIVFNAQENDTDDVAFALNAVSITTSPIPEPTTVGGLGLILVLGTLSTRSKIKS